MVPFQIHFAHLDAENFIPTSLSKQRSSEGTTEEPAVDGITAIFMAELTFTSRSISRVTALLHVV